MHLLGFLAIGAAAGWLAGRLMKERPFGLGGDLVVGVIGSIVGGQVFGLLGLAAYGNTGIFVTALVGAMVLLYLLGVLHLRPR
jgi:uncharacterized membrane protein YeaQ/YmgE (transglycosylase-associated protein family)